MCYLLHAILQYTINDYLYLTQKTTVHIYR